MRTPLSALVAVLTLAAVPAPAIELSLEENRAERGNIGYIDMQKVFKTSPETVRAKENFEEILRQTEEQVNLRKAEILRLRSEISGLKIQRDFLSKTPLSISSDTAQAPAAVSTRPAGADLPGFAAPLFSTSAPALIDPPRPEVPILLPPTTGPSAPPQAPAGASPEAAIPALAELDAGLSDKTKELSAMEASFKDYQANAERNLLSLESRKTEILLGKMHKAIQEVARKEGISVVVDKSSILFGHDAVDLTDKVLKHLSAAEENPRSP